MNKKIRAIDIEIATMQYYGVRQNMIVPNVHWGMANLHECDLLVLTKSNYATEIEIKISKADLLKDKDKKHQHKHNHIKYLYFAVPEELKEIALESIPERAGLLIASYAWFKDWDSSGFPKDKKQKLVVRCVKTATENKNAHKWTDDEKNNLARLGVMRILGLKRKIANKQI